MELRKEKALAFFLISASFLLTGHLVFRSFALLGEDRNLFESLLNSSTPLFSPIILLSFFGLGPFLGWSIFLLSSVAVVIAIASSYLYGLLFQIALFLIMASTGNRCIKKVRKLESDMGLEAEQYEERINLINNECETQRKTSDILKRRLSRYSLLKTSAEKLSSITSLDKIADYLADEAFNIIGKSDAALLYLVDEEHQGLKLTSSRKSNPADKIKSKKGDIFDSWTLKHRKPLLVTDTRKDFRFNMDAIEEDERSVVSLISAPLISERRTLGILRLENARPDAYSADDLRLLDVACDLGALAIANCVLYKKTEELAITDGLTGLYVRRYFTERATEELKRAAQSKLPISFLMADIDHFKNYNDRYGHVAGDIVLRRLSVVLRKGASNEDLICRFGGEEFGILIIGKDKEAAILFSETLRRDIEKEEITLRRERTGITVSMGMSFYPADGTDIEAIIKSADTRLYKAKSLGRNRICVE